MLSESGPFPVLCREHRSIKGAPPLGGSGGMLPREILQSPASEEHFSCILGLDFEENVMLKA